ncbi:sugar phosphate isomerase/epimerase family protein [Calycomorphotria hydatis]|uniref:Xylose isomerase-like TIM barrel n=1 Tax=Calycomorphotria hydatis TaxID=2528027 RepID=A0A517T8Y1_9PLAN|nr:sugar phosphate isomerase/epimerase family protein [Calycomorphotria hydatis]QDT64823.1 Xylose isomerase-like TIM barrel [Calycomorphotria hydatis]
MPSSPSLDRLAIHTITTKPWDLMTAIDEYSSRNIPGISIWTDTLEGLKTEDVTSRLNDAGMRVPALVRGGFFPAVTTAERQSKIDENKNIIATAAELSADMVVLVVGAVPGLPLDEQRQMVADGIAAVLPDAEAAGVKLAIEPLHPMYADNRSCVCRMTEAREICEALDHPLVGIAVDVYHVWWDADLEEEIKLAGEQNRLFGFHVCDWRVPTRQLMNDRGLMGEGCINIPQIRGWVEAAGFDGDIEVEIFSDEYWAQDQGQFLDSSVTAYQTAV